MLFRNLPLVSTKDFSQFFTSLGNVFFGESVTGYRTAVQKNVHTASDDLPEFNTEPHNEASYSPRFPTKVIVFCVQEPEPACGSEIALLKRI